MEQAEKNNLQVRRYDHARLEKRRRFLRFLIRVIGFNFLVKLDQVDGLENIPSQGAGIVMMNHIAFLDPIVVLHAIPRNIIPLAKIEVYNYPFVGIFPRLWEVIPVRREEVDRRAIQHALDILKAGELILVAPEGTRGPQLKQGKEGVAYLASRSGAPVIPTAVTQTSGFPAFRTSSRWREPGSHVIFGRPFRFHASLRRAGGDKLREMTDEAMYVLASMLPENLRGVYSNPPSGSFETLDFI
jgi:1-acyl-sn-glycerol-3-phosphate acyltransferase